MFCTRCKQEKLEDDFPYDKGRRFGRYPYCKVCLNAYTKKLWERKQKGYKPRSYKLKEEVLELLSKGLKRCCRCKEVKTREEFDNSRRARDGKFSRCKLCKSIEKAIQYDQTYDGKTNTRLFQVYGITLDEYNTMVQTQNGKCRICDKAPKHRLCVDHDHETGKIRGLLCKKCNLAIGNLDEDIDRFRKAVEYLQSFGMYNLRA